MNKFIQTLKLALIASTLLAGTQVFADARVMNPGETVGQLVVLSAADIKGESAKYKSITALSIPVFEELPYQLGVIGGAITLKQQNLISHVQLKCVAAGRPNLDISNLEGGMLNPLLSQFHDGDWISMKLTEEGGIELAPSTEEAALEFYKKKMAEIKEFVPKSDLTVVKLIPHSELTWEDKDLVGSKAANYSQLIRILNSEREVVRPGFAIPFAYYEAFINGPAEGNIKLKKAIKSVLGSILMNKVADVEYRMKRLEEIQALIMSPEAVIDPAFIQMLIAKMDTYKDPVTGIPRQMKLRSSTNAEDLPNFNGAGLYDSDAYKPSKNGVEKHPFDKMMSLEKALRTVWASIWNIRAWDERTSYKIKHSAVKMAIQVNPSYVNEFADGVVVTKNVLKDPKYPGAAVYIETQRGDKHGVANPEPGVTPQKVLVQIDRTQPLNKDSYKVNIIQQSNIADDMNTILPTINPTPVMTDDEIKELVYQSVKAELAFKPLLGAENDDFALDLEFKVATGDDGKRGVFIKQGRPYID